MQTKEFIKQQWVKDEIISRLNYCPETGSLTWAERSCKSFDSDLVGKEVGHKWTAKDGYKSHGVKLTVKGRVFGVVVARLCWLVHTGDWPKHTIDHINRDTYDNRWDNLRDVTQAENNSNKGLYKRRHKPKATN